MGVRVGVAIGSINRYWREQYISVQIYSSIKTVGGTILGGLWTLEWAWHSAETNLRWAGISGICMPNPNVVACIVSEISAFIRTDGQKDRRTDGQTERRTWLDRLGYTEKKIDMIWWSIWWNPVSIRPRYGTYQFDMFEIVKTIYW